MAPKAKKSKPVVQKIKPKIERVRLPSLFELYHHRCALTDEVQQSICSNIKRGLTITATLSLAEVSEASHMKWLDYGKRYLHTEPRYRTDEIESWERYGEYYLEFKKAIAMWQEEKISSTLQGSSSSSWLWQRDLTLLRTRTRSDFGDGAPDLYPISPLEKNKDEDADLFL